MNLQDLQEFLKDENNAEAFKKIVTAMGYRDSDEINTLTSEKEAERKKRKEYQEKFNDLKKRLDDLEGNRYTGKDEEESDVKKAAKAERELQRITALLQEKEKEAASKTAALNQIKISDSLRKAFRASDIDPVHDELLISAFAGKAEVDEDNVYIGNTAVSDYFSNWVKDSGAMYKKQPENHGAKAPQLRGKIEKVMRKEDFDQMSAKERSSFMADGGEVTE